MLRWFSVLACLASMHAVQAQTAQGRFEEPQLAPAAKTAEDEVLVKFTSVPAGAAVTVDGKRLCEAAPCRKRLIPAEHEVVFELPLYAQSTLRVTFREGLEVKAALVSNSGTITVLSSVKGIGVALNGKDVGKAPLAKLSVEAGEVEVAVADRCFVRSGERFDLKVGERKKVQLIPQPVMAALKVQAEDDDGNALEGKVVVDGKVIGPIGKTLSVPLCSKRVALAGIKGWSEELELNAGKMTEIRYAAGREKDNLKVMNTGLLGNMGGAAGSASNVFGPDRKGKGSNEAPERPSAEEKAPSMGEATGVAGLGLGGLGTRGVGQGRPPRFLRPATLPKDVIYKVIRRHENEIKYCYESQLQRTPGLTGKLLVTWGIDLSGSVQKANVAESTVGNADLEACILKRVQAWKFPEPEGNDGLVTVSFPWAFTPAGSEDE